MLGGLQAVREELADCVLQLGERGVSIPIHAVVGAINSGHIRGALRSGVGSVDYNGRQVRRIVLPCGPEDILLGQIPEAGVRMLVDFWYMEKLELGEGIAQAADVWCAANYLQAWKGVMDACEAHVRSSLSAATWAEAWTLGNVYGRTGLCAAAIEFASTRFKAVTAHLSWAHAPLEAVKQVFSYTWLQVDNEDFVLQAALSWAEYKGEGLADLLSLVRLPQVTKSAMDKLKVHPLVSQSVACLELLAEAAAWAPAGEAGGRLWGPRAAHRSLVVVGGGRAQRYDALTNTWAELPPPGVSPWFASAASLGERLYLAGGYDDQSAARSAQVTCFDPAAANGAGAWAAVAPMGIARAYAAAASLNGLLYVAGGFSVNVDLRTVDRYSPASGTWEAVASMTSARYEHQLVALAGLLYAIGGDSDGGNLTTAERYDPATNTWTPIASTASPRYQCAAAAMGGFLYVTGGYVDGGVLSSCELYDPASNTWSRIADLPEPRYGHALACLGGSLYAVGGKATRDDPASTSPPWRYDVSTDTWVPAPLAAGSVEMSGFGVDAGWTAL